MKILIAILTLLSFSAFADTINCTSSNPCNGTENADTITGTDDANNIYALAGNDDVDGRLGNDLYDLGEGNDHCTALGSGNKTVYPGNGNDACFLAGNNNTHVFDATGTTGTKTVVVPNILGDATATITLAAPLENECNLVSVGKKTSTVNGGSGCDIMSADELATSLPGQIHYFYGNDGPDNIKTSTGEDYAEGGDDADSLRSLNGSAILKGGADNDQIFLGQGNPIAWGDAGADNFILTSNAATGGDKEIVDFASAKTLDFTLLPNVTLESLACCIYFVEEPPSMLASKYAPTRDGALAYREAKKKLPSQRKWKRLHTSSKTAIEALRKGDAKFCKGLSEGQCVIRNGKQVLAEIRRQLQIERLTERTSGLFISSALANPGPEPGDMIIANDVASVLIKNGEELVMTGQFTINNMIFAP